MMGQIARRAVINSVFDFLPGRVMLGLATLAYCGIASISFIVFLLPSAALARGRPLTV
jgi:hypothetical protein